MKKIIGIDLGTTYSAIAQIDETGSPVPLPNEDEEPETPSLVLLTGDNRVIVREENGLSPTHATCPSRPAPA